MLKSDTPALILGAVTLGDAIHIGNRIFTKRRGDGIGARWSRKGSGHEQASEQQGGANGENNHADAKEPDIGIIGNGQRVW